MKRLLLAALLTTVATIGITAAADETNEAPTFVLEGQIVGQDLIGLVPEGLRLNGHTSGVITEGILVGATTNAIDYMHYRHDGVGVIHVRGYSVHPDGFTVAVTMKGFLGEPSPGLLEAMLDPAFEPPDVDIPLHGAAWFETMAPAYAFLNHTVFGFSGTINMVTGALRVTYRSLAP
jgi:hypothetical protein